MTFAGCGRIGGRERSPRRAVFLESSSRHAPALFVPSVRHGHRAGESRAYGRDLLEQKARSRPRRGGRRSRSGSIGRRSPVATVAGAPGSTAGTSYAAAASPTGHAPAPATTSANRSAASSSAPSAARSTRTSRGRARAARWRTPPPAARRRRSASAPGTTGDPQPRAPGMKFETLLSFVKKGRVKPTSIVRGPTTHQLWRFAAQVKGLSREFGVCYSCGTSIDRAASICPQCNRLQDPPPFPDVLLETGKEGAATPGSLVGTPMAPGTPPAAAGVPANGAAPAGQCRRSAARAVARERRGRFRRPRDRRRRPRCEPERLDGRVQHERFALGYGDRPAVGPDRPEPLAEWPRRQRPRPRRRAAPRRRARPRPPSRRGRLQPDHRLHSRIPHAGQGTPYGYGEAPYGQPPAGGRRPGPAARRGRRRPAGFGGNGRPQRAEGFLSARDLAAAFKLQLADDDDPNAAAARAGRAGASFALRLSARRRFRPDETRTRCSTRRRSAARGPASGRSRSCCC